MSRPAWARWVTRISLVVGLVALVVTIYNIGPKNIARYVERIGWWWFAVIALEVAITTLDAIAIRAFLSPESGLVKLRSALLSQLAGRAVNAVTPSGNLGEAVKVSVLTEYVSQSRAVATILLYNVISFAIELWMVALAALVLVIFVPLGSPWTGVMIATCVICTLLGIGMLALARRGLLGTLVGAIRRLRLISEARHARWLAKLAPVDDKMKLVEGARKRDRTLGIAAVVISRLTSMSLSYLVFHAVGGTITVSFVAATTVGGFVIYILSTLVPMGVGISEGGYWGMFRAIGENPARGVTMVIARRVTLVAYAAIGLVLMTASETVRRARDSSVTPSSPP
ncbi:MAG: YbhN family protein [Kofleriaceae bacterium]